MAAFDPVVEVDFTGSGTWTDISAYVRVSQGIRITRGRGDEQTEVRPGTMSLVLDNRDGRFTPGNPASPYWPNVRKGRPIRCSVVVGGITYRRFFGYVNEWPVAWEGGTALTLSHLTATDVFKRLGTMAPMRSLLEEEMLALGPDAYYTLAEGAGSTSAGDTSGKGQPPMTVYQVAGSAGEVNFGSGKGPGTDGLAATVFKPASATDGKALRVDLKAAPPSGNRVVVCWINTTVTGRTFLQIGNRFDGVGGAATVFRVHDTVPGQLIFVSFKSDSLTISGGFTTTPANLADGKTHLVAVLLEATGRISVSVDGAASPTVFTGVQNVIDAARGYDRLVTGGERDPVDWTPKLFDGTLSHFWYAERATMPDWSNVWAAGNQETTTSRFARLCRLLSLTGSTLGSSTTSMDAQVAGGKAPIVALRDVAGVEAGLVYASRADASVVFECRAYRYGKAASITLAADQLREGSLQWSDDDQYLVNDVTNRRDGGAAQRYAAPASIQEYGTYAGGASLPWASDADALMNAQWHVSNGADPPPRITRFSVVANSLASYQSILGLNISDVVSLTNLPITSPEQSTKVNVEGYSETIEFNYHTITFNTSPARISNVWRLGVAGSSELGVNTKLAL